MITSLPVTTVTVSKIHRKCMHYVNWYMQIIYDARYACARRVEALMTFKIGFYIVKMSYIHLIDSPVKKVTASVHTTKISLRNKSANAMVDRKNNPTIQEKSSRAKSDSLGGSLWPSIRELSRWPGWSWVKWFSSEKNWGWLNTGPTKQRKELLFGDGSGSYVASLQSATGDCTYYTHQN